MVDCTANRRAWSSKARPAQQHGHDGTTGRILSIVAAQDLVCLHTAAPEQLSMGDEEPQKIGVFKQRRGN